VTQRPRAVAEERALDEQIEYLAIACSCDACERLRRFRLQRAADLAARLEEQIGAQR
jgi:hypothetical protein